MDAVQSYRHKMITPARPMRLRGMSGATPESQLLFKRAPASLQLDKAMLHWEGQFGVPIDETS